jgi:hypothetical protein
MGPPLGRPPGVSNWRARFKQKLNMFVSYLDKIAAKLPSRNKRVFGPCRMSWPMALSP